MTYSESTVYQRNSKLWFQIWLHSEPQHWETLAGFYPDILFNELSLKVCVILQYGSLAYLLS